MALLALALLGLFAAGSGYESQDGWINLNVGDKIQVTLDYGGNHGWLSFFLTDNATYNVMTVFGASPEGPVWYTTLSGCYEPWSGCTNHTEVTPDGKQDFAKGKHTFQVARRPGVMEVWHAMHPHHVATLPTTDLKDGRGRLRVTVALGSHGPVDFEDLLVAVRDLKW